MENKEPHFSSGVGSGDFGRFEQNAFKDQQNPGSGSRTVPAISNLVSNISGYSHNGEEVREQIPLVPHETVIVDATLLENFGNHPGISSEPSLLMMTDSGVKRKEDLSDSSTQSKRHKKMDDLSSEFDENNSEYDEQQAYEAYWQPPPLEPLPISVTLPFIRAHATKKFEGPIPLFVPPALPVGNLHHFPALLTLPSFMTLPTAIPIFPQHLNFVSPLGYYSYGDDGEFGYSQDDESEGEDSYDEEDDQIVQSSVIHSPPSHAQMSHASPLTTLASLASGTVKSHSQI